MLEDVLELLPLPALVVVDGVVRRGNAAARDLVGVDASAFVDGLRDGRSRQRFEELLRAADERVGGAVAIRWGDEVPSLSLMTVARRVDERTVLLMFTDDREAQRLDGVLTAYVNAVVAFDGDGRILWGSRGMAEAYGAANVGGGLKDQAHPEDHAHIDAVYGRALAHPRRKTRSSFRVAHRDVPDMYWRLDAVSMNLLDDATVGAVITTFGPHTDLGPGDDGARETMQMTDIMPVGIISAAADGACYYRNRLAIQLAVAPDLGADAASFVERARPEDHEPLHRAMKEAMSGNRSDPVVAAFATPAGIAWYRIEFNPQFDVHGEAQGWVAALLDVTAEVEAREELKRVQQHLWHLANHDALTGLPNRPAVLDRIESALARARREPHAVALLYGDLDGFKPINDQHGHEAGDEVLRAVAGRLQALVRDTDTVGRLGGDEFVVLCETFDDDDVVRSIASRIEASIATPISLRSDGDPVAVAITIGVAVARPGESSDELLARADQAMYAAKRR